MLEFEVLLLKLVSVLHASAYAAFYILLEELHLLISRTLFQQFKLIL